MKRFLAFSLSCSFLFFSLFILFHQTGTAKASIQSEDKAPGIIMADQAVKEKKLWITTDHSKHDILKKKFKSGPEVTMACLSCHTEAALQFHKTIHWTWMVPETKQSIKLGKGGLSINNF